MQISEETNQNIKVLRRDHVGAFFSQFILQGTDAFIKNIKTQMILLSFDGRSIPITVNDAEYDNSFVCSPYSHYVSYAGILSERIKNPVLRKIYASMIKLYGSILKTGKINKVVIVNNWLLTTNPPLNINVESLRQLLGYLTKRFPDHAIIFRSVTQNTSPQFYSALQQNHFEFLASRFVYISDARREDLFQTRIFKSDIRLLKGSPFTILSGKEVAKVNLQRLVDLYQMLYIRKYSSLNPQFTEPFLKLAIEQDVIHLKVLKLRDSIIGVCGYVIQDGVMTSPFFGYDPSDEKNSGIYRILSTLLLLEAKDKKVVFNQSAGGAFFKKIRRAEGHMENTAIYIKHLPLKRKLPWIFLKGVLNTIGKFCMRRY